jgi:tetratricopeptide (TPR) repeat protein
MLGGRALAWISAVSVAWACGALPLAAQQPGFTPGSPQPSPTSPRTSPAVPAPQTPRAAPSVAAPAPAAEPSPDAKERARTAYARGQSAFAAGDYISAKDAFQQAFEAVPNPIVLLSVAESASKLGKLDEAIAAFDRYLQLRPDAPDRVDVEQKRAALAVTPAALSVISEPPGAEIVLDGQPTGRQTPAELQLSAGQHLLELSLVGYDKPSETLDVAPGARIERRVVLQKPAPPPPPVAPPAEPLAPAALPKPEVPVTALWITGGLGAAGIIAGSVLGFLALKEHSDFEKTPTESSADRGERLALFADVGFGVGAMALVTAAVLYLTYDDVQPEAQARRVGSTRALASTGAHGGSGARLEIIPRISPNAASASARIRF